MEPTKERVLDLFSGLRGWSDAWRERGHEVFAIDNARHFDADAYVDIMDVGAVLDAVPWMPTVILASPPCTGFTVMNIGRNWTHAGEPKTEVARVGLLLVKMTLSIIAMYNPRVWIIENPRAKLRALPVLRDYERRTVTYCRLGERRMKPTDLWGKFPPTLTLPEACQNGNSDHISAPRGSTTGTQGMDSATAAKVPHALALMVCEATESMRNPQ